MDRRDDEDGTSANSQPPGVARLMSVRTVLVVTAVFLLPTIVAVAAVAYQIVRSGP